MKNRKAELLKGGHAWFLTIDGRYRIVSIESEMLRGFVEKAQRGELI